jgi:hypothetical protein
VISDQFKRKQWKPHTESFEKSPIETLPGFPIKCQCRKNRERLESFSTTKSRSLCVWKMTSILHHSNVEEHNQTPAHCLVLCSCNADQDLNCRVPPSPFKVTSFRFTNLIAVNDDRRRRNLDRYAEHEYYYPVSQKLVICLQHPQTELWGRGGGGKLRGAAYQYSQERSMQQAPQSPLHAVSLSILKTQ